MRRWIAWLAVLAVLTPALADAQTKPARPRPPVHRPRPPVYPRAARGHQFYHRGFWNERISSPGYVYPRGWQYRRFGIGMILPAALYVPAYYYDGWAALKLEEPAPGYSWVRFGPDLILVNLHTGEIEDIVYGAFTG